MKKFSIRLRQNLFRTVHTGVLANGSNESVAFVTAKHFETTEKTVFLADTMVPAKEGDYLRQGPFHLKVSPLYVNRVLNVAEDQKNTVIMVHSHPFEKGSPEYSPTDDHGEALTSETISKCLEANPPVASMLFGETQVVGRAWAGLSKQTASSSINVLGGTSFEFHPAEDEAPKKVAFESVDRQIKALGESLQTTIELLDIGIVGLGGTGSAVAEQLARMGVRKLRLVDHDIVEMSNISRLYGSTPDDAKKRAKKVDVVASHLKKINPNLEIVKLSTTVMKRENLATLSNCDIIFSCLDRHAPRAVLNELSYQCFVPVIDVGVGIQRDDKGFMNGAVRATIIGPDLPCLICQEIVRPEMITAENLSPEEYELRRVEGYVADFQQRTPSVINFTTLASSFAITMFTEMISGRSDNSYSTLLIDIRSKDIMRLRGRVKADCVCQKRLGKGFGMPFSVAD